MALVPVVAGCAQQTVRLEPSITLQAEGGPIMAAAFSHDGSALATGGDIGDLRVLDMPARTVRWTTHPSDHWIGVVAFSPDGRKLACLGRDLTLHDAATGEELNRFDGAGPHGFAWSRDGKCFAYAPRCDVVVVDGERATTWARFEYPINALAFADDGAIFAGDNVGRTWRVPAGGGQQQLHLDHRKSERDNTRSIDVACAGGALFDLASEGPLRRGSASFELPSTAFDLATTPDGRSFAVGGLGQRRTVYPVDEPAIVRWWIDDGSSFDDITVPGNVAALALHPDGQTLFVSTYNGRQALHVREREPVDLPGHRSRVRGLAMTPDGTVLAVQGQQWSLHPLDGRPKREVPGALDVEQGRNDAELLVQFADRVVVLDARDDAVLASVPTPRRHRLPAQVGPGDLLLVEDELVDAAGDSVAKLPKDVLLHNGFEVALANDGRWAVGGVSGIEGDLGGLVISDAQGKNLRVVDDSPVYSLAFAPDGKRIYYGCGDGISTGMGPPEHYLRVRDADTLELVHQLDVPVMAWRFLDARRALVIVGDKLQVWDVDRLEAIETVPLDVACHGFLLSADRRTFAIATTFEVRVYRLL